MKKTHLLLTTLVLFMVAFGFTNVNSQSTASDASVEDVLKKCQRGDYNWR